MKYEAKTMKSGRKIRAIYDTDAAKERYHLYKSAIEQLNKAYTSGFYIEAVAICESLISDRLHARYSHLKKHEQEARREKDLKKLITLLKNNDLKKHKELHKIYDDIDLWRESRNDAIHGAVKLREGLSGQSFAERYEKVKEAAEEGQVLFRKLKKASEQLKNRKNVKIKMPNKTKKAQQHS